MFAIPGLVCLIMFLYLRPQEYFVDFQKLPLLYIFFALAVGGLIVDLRLRLIKPVAGRTLLLAVLFWVWCIVVIAVKVPAELQMAHGLGLTILLVTFVVLSQGVQSFRAFRVMAGTLIFIGLFLAAVGIHQRLAPHGCILLTDPIQNVGEPDGRPCETFTECLGADAEPGALYDCQRIGLFGTMAVDERVRYRGELQDPNELALVVSATLPLLLAMAMIERRSRWRLLTALGGSAILVCVIFTQSRGGMLALITVLGIYFIKRHGIRYVLPGVLALLPLLALGGRSGAAADESTIGRYEAWREATMMIRQDPIFGVGQGMFTEHHHLTAHNSYVLAAAELGLLGMLLWVAILYVTIKIPVMALRDFRHNPAARTARTWALCLLAVCAAFLIQMMFLSLTYHTMTWVLFGLAGAYYSTVKQHAPAWEVKLGLLDVALVGSACAGFLALLHLFLMFRGY